LQKIFVAHMKIDELLSENAKIQAQIGPKPEKSKNTPNFYNTFSHFPKFKDTSSIPNDKPSILNQIKKTSLNKSLTSFNNDQNNKAVEADFKKNSESIEKLKEELRFLLMKYNNLIIK